MYTRTNIEINDKLIKNAMKYSRTSTKKEVVEKGLELLVKLAKQAEIKGYFGKLHWEGDLDEMRED